MNTNIDILDMTSAGQVCHALAEIGNDLVKLEYIAGTLGMDRTAIVNALVAVERARDKALEASKGAA